MDFDEFLKLFLLYTVIAYGGGFFLVGKTMGGFNHWRSPATRQQLLFLAGLATLIWGVCEVNGFGFGLALIGWAILIASFVVGGLLVWTLDYCARLEEEELPHDVREPIAKLSFSTPPSLTAFDRSEAQTWFWSNQRFSHD